MFKRFVAQKPTSSFEKESPNSDKGGNDHLASRELKTSTTNIHQKPMAEHGGKDILSSDVEIKGSIKFQKELHIDGKVEGEINSEGVLTIGENANIRGEIKAKAVTVYGKVQVYAAGRFEGRAAHHRRRGDFYRQIGSHDRSASGKINAT